MASDGGRSRSKISIRGGWTNQEDQLLARYEILPAVSYLCFVCTCTLDFSIFGNSRRDRIPSFLVQIGLGNLVWRKSFLRFFLSNFVHAFLAIFVPITSLASPRTTAVVQVPKDRTQLTQPVQDRSHIIANFTV